MKRSPLKIALVVLGYLAAGAVVNVVVAAGCALWSPLNESCERDYRTMPRWVERWAPAAWLQSSGSVMADFYEVDARERRGIGVGVLQIEGTWRSSNAGISMTHFVFIVVAGWPWRCIEAATPWDGTDWPKSHSVRSARIEPAIRVPWQCSPIDSHPVGEWPHMNLSHLVRDVIPLSPMWPALIANTLVWALILAVFVHGPRLVREEIRMRRGLCRSCAYPIGVSEKCTECGRELPGWVLKLRGDSAARAAMSEHKPEG